MGGCRMLNVLLGMSVLPGPWRIAHWAAAAGVGVYIAGVTWFARNDARRSDRWQLIAARWSCWPAWDWSAHCRG